MDSEVSDNREDEVIDTARRQVHEQADDGTMSLEPEHIETEAARPPPGAPPDSFVGYKIARELHRGRQGVVYQAFQESAKRRLATLVLSLFITVAAAGQTALEPDFAGVIISPKLKPAIGTRPVLAILWDPHRPDHPAPSARRIERLLFGRRPSVRDWFRENSGGKFEIEKAAVLGWFDADKPGEHYWSSNAKKDPNDSDGDGWLSGHTEKWTEAIRKADRQFDFAKYDADQDGVLSSRELGILIAIPQKRPFGTNRPPAGRQFPKREALIVDAVRIPLIAEWYTGDPPNLGAPAHELCHLLLGTPDLYMAGKPWPYSAGDYSLMDHSYTTAHLDPFEKMKLGWLNVEVVSKSGVYRLKNVERTGQALLMYDPHRGPGEYFLLENRWRGASYDAGAGRAGRGIRDEGLAVWHVLEDPELWKTVRPPVGGVREWGRRGIRLIRANGDDPLDDRTALFDKKGTVLSDESRPVHLRWLDGTQSGFRVELLSSGGSTMRVRVNSPAD